MKRKILFTLLAAVFAAGIAFAEKLPVAKAVRPEKELYKTFANPDGRHRPYVRWWWNGARVNEQEILRELDVMREAGIGGVEINTIQFPDQTTDTVGCAALTWLSDEWIRMVNVAADGCRERGMVCDIIVAIFSMYTIWIMPRSVPHRPVGVKRRNLSLPVRRLVGRVCFTSL